MILGQDQAMMFPTMDLYDSGMMKLYADAVQKEYERGLTEQKEFMAKYGDFTSPIARDVEAWNQSTMEPISQMVDDMIAHGIDPTRSPEARAILSRRMSTIPYAKLAEMKQSAENAKLYLKNRAEMQAKGLWNPEFENFILGGKTLENWDTSKNGMWTRLAPESYQDLNEYTGHIFDKMQDEYIETIDGYDYSGVSRDRRADALTPRLSGLLSTNLGKFHYEKAREDAAIRYGRTPTEAEVMDQFQDNILKATAEYERRTRKENEEYGRSRDYYWNDRLDAAKSSRQYAYKTLEDVDFNKDGVISQEEREFYDNNARTMMENEANYKYNKNGKKSSRGGSSDKEGHTHLGEIYTRAINSGTNGLNVLSDPNATGNFVGNQKTNFKNSGFSYDSEGTINQMFKGRTSTKNNFVEMSSDDIDRLYSWNELHNSAYGLKHDRPKGDNHVKNFSKSGKYLYGMRPTGRIKVVFGSDGRFRTYAEMSVYFREKETVTTKEPGPIQESKNKYYYDTHITSVKNEIPTRKIKVDKSGNAQLISVRNSGEIPIMNLKTKRINKPAFYDLREQKFIPKMKGSQFDENVMKMAKSDTSRYISSDYYYAPDMSNVPDFGELPTEQFDWSIDPIYEPEVESMDINVGKSFGDTNQRTNEDTYIE